MSTNQSYSSDRRAALKKIVLTTTAGLFAHPLFSAHQPIAEEEKLGIALVGLGRYSQLVLKSALGHCQRVKLTGIVTGSPEKAAEWSRSFDLPQENIYDYDRFDQIADNPAIDIIYIVLPNFMHAEYSIRALKAGKHVICEKPMAMNPAECQQMIDAAQQANRLLSVGYRLHYEPLHQELMRLGKEKPFGPINLIEGSLGYHMPDPTHWRLDKAKGGGGAIMDLGVYPIQAARYITGEEPLSVTAQGVIRDKKRFKDIYESISWQFRFPSGAMSNHTTTYSSYTDHLRVGCYQGWFGLKPAFGAGRLNGYKMNEPLDFPEVNQQALHMDDFAQSIQDNKPVKVGGEEGLQDIRIVQAILKAADTGREVMIKGE